MNGEVENNNENNKKEKIVALVGLATLLIAVLGATYAFFQINTNNESSNTSITGSTPEKSLVTLNQGTNNLHLNISASDMSYDNKTKEYYGTDVENKSYEENETDGTKTIAEVELTGGEATTKYSCTAKLTVSKVTEPDTEKDTMVEVLQPGDMILQFNGNIISEKLDLSELNPEGSKEYDLKFKVTGNTPEEIQAYIKLVNKETQQNYLAGSKLNIDINTSELKCEVFIPDPKVAELREDDEQGYLSEDLQGGMYRYQAAPADENETAQMTNWICFGTTENCGIDETDSDSNNIPDGIDKYMYRIIGITEEGEMYLLKETFLKEGETNQFVWNSKYRISDCLGEACEWPNSDLYRRINGLSNGEVPGTGYGDGASTDIFVDSKYYDYLKSGDKDGINGGETSSDWYNLIEKHNWMYGDENEDYPNNLSADYMYGIETGKIATKRYWPDEETQTTCSSDSLCTEKEYTWKKIVNARIGLLYRHDRLFSEWIDVLVFGRGTYSEEWVISRNGLFSASSSNVTTHTKVLGGSPHFEKS